MFKVGDVVMVIQDEYYSITKNGSYGVVVYSDDNHTRVKFEYIPCGILDTYIIDTVHLALHHIYTKEERVCLKISAMYNRQKERGIVHV